MPRLTLVSLIGLATCLCTACPLVTNTMMEEKLEPSITITSPENGTQVEMDIILAWEVKTFQLAPDAVGWPSEAGIGHVHIYINDNLFEPTAEKEMALNLGGEGFHKLEVRLASNDHTELAASDSIEVEVVSDGIPRITIASPPPFEPVPPDFEVRVNVSNFDLVDSFVASGETEDQTQGHWHLYLGAVYLGYSVEESMMVNSAPAGETTIRVGLAEMDHDEIETDEARDFVEVTVE